MCTEKIALKHVKMAISQAVTVLQAKLKIVSKQGLI
jgi:hypothetical protein